MAGPHKNDQEKRIVQVNIRLTADEYERVSRYALASNLKPANCIRKKVFTGKFPAPKLSPLERDIFLDLRRIGVNLNQATKKINQGEMHTDFLLSILQTRSLLDKIFKKLNDDRQPD